MEINAYSINMDNKNRKEPTWEKALRAAEKEVDKKLALVKQVMYEMSKEKSCKLQCPYCGYSTRYEGDFHSHLKYCHWVSISAIEEIIRELTGRK